MLDEELLVKVLKKPAFMVGNMQRFLQSIGSLFPFISKTRKLKK
jgi:hypothetical protein